MILSRVRLGALLVLIVPAVQLQASPAATAALRPLSLGFGDSLFSDPSAGVRATWLARSTAVGAQVLRIDAGWLASRRPVHPTDPADPAYSFASLDAVVRDATARRLTPLLVFTGAPPWAEGPGRPADAPPGAWLPDPAAVGAYGHALALRYDGRYPDPLRPGTALPRVRLFQVWNEPNLSIYLSPQWQTVRGRWTAVAPAHYRAMLNAFYADVKSAQPHATVVTAGTSPFGDFGHGQRMMPLLFWRTVFRARVSFDALAHHPYSYGAPRIHALNADDITIPDMGKLSNLLHSAEHRGTALPREHHAIWVTEIGYNTRPPNPIGVDIATDARWLEQALYLLWKQGVSVVTWFQIRDEPPIPSYRASYQAGVYFLNGRRKPAALAFRFPVVADPNRAGGATVWVRAPGSGVVQVDALGRGPWRRIASRRVRAAQVFEVTAPRGTRDVRASLGGLRSLVWRVVG